MRQNKQQGEIKRKDKENIREVHGGLHIKQIKNLNAIVVKMRECS